MAAPIRVLVVDDSALMRRLVSDMLAADPGIEVVGTARDGDDALAKIPVLTPHVVTLDVEMPGRDGISTLVEIMRRHPLPVVMLSSLTQAGAEATLRALSLGAVEFVAKPSGAISMDVAEVAAETIAKVRAAASARPTPLAPSGPRTRPAARPRRAGGLGALVIGASTGGPNALATLLPMLSADLGVPIVVVQHMGPAFTRLLAARLSEASGLVIREAESGDRLHAGTVLLAPGGRHLEFNAGGIVRLSDGPNVHGVRPSIDVTMLSLVALYGGRTVGILLTGMGRDGASGLKAIRDAGGRTIAESESTSVVYGMPRVAAEIGAVERVLPLPRIADAILDFVSPSSSPFLPFHAA